MTEKRCNKCKEVKPLEEFRNYACGIAGKAPRCRICSIEDERISRAKYRSSAKGIATRKANSKARHERLKNDPDHKKKKAKWERERKQRNPGARMRSLLGTALWNALKGKNKIGSVLDHVGVASKDELFDYLTEGGKINPDGMHIDHIIPQSWADDTKPEEIYALYSKYNLRLVPSSENIRRKAKPPHPDDLHPNLPELAMKIYEREKYLH